MPFVRHSISTDEVIARFLFHNGSEYSVSKNMVKSGAFSPHKGETSVFRISSPTGPENINENDIWILGRDYVEPGRGKPIRARADVAAATVLLQSLRIDPDSDPHERHAAIKGWPIAKEQELEIAQELAKQSRLVIRPPSA